MRVTAKATRSGDWWAVEVPEVPGVFTQTRRLDQIDAMVRDAVALMTGVEPEAVEISVDPHTDLDDVVAEALNARQEAEAARERANELVREAMLKLAESGVTVRDSGEILGVSAQRVSQVLNSPAMDVMRKAARAAVTSALHGSKAEAVDAGRAPAAQEVLAEAIDEVSRRKAARATSPKVSKGRSAITGKFTETAKAAKR